MDFHNNSNLTRVYTTIAIPNKTRIDCILQYVKYLYVHTRKHF